MIGYLLNITLIPFLRWNIDASMNVRNRLIAKYPDKNMNKKAKKLLLDLISNGDRK